MRDVDLAGEQDVLAGLGHDAVGGRDDQDRAVHLRGAGDHVLDVVGVTRAVDVGVVPVVGLVLDVGGRDRDPALLLLGSVVDLLEALRLGAALGGERLGDRGRQRRLAVVDMTDRADVHMRLIALELLLGHRSPFYLSKVVFCLVWLVKFCGCAWQGLALPAGEPGKYSQINRAAESVLSRGRTDRLARTVLDDLPRLEWAHLRGTETAHRIPPAGLLARIAPSRRTCNQSADRR